MGKVIFDDKIKAQASGLPDVNSFLDKNANDLRDAINDNDDRITVIETGRVNEAIQVSAIWDVNLDFDVTADNFPVNGIYYASTPDSVTVTAPVTPGNTVIHWIVAIAPIAPDTIGTVGFIPGDEAVPGVATTPDFDPTLVYPIKFVEVEHGETSPKDTLRILAFDENTGSPTEFDYVSSSANIVVTTNNPFIGTKSIEATNQIKGDRNTLTKDSTFSTGTIDLLTFQLRLKADLGNSAIRIIWKNGNVTVGNSYSFRTGSNGLDSTLIDAYQEIRIDGDKFNLPVEDVDSFQIYIYKSFLGYNLDLIQIHQGSGSTPPPGSGIEDAPFNDLLHGRINGLWQALTFGFGDMILDAIQTVTAAKTFEEGTLLLRNVADTFSSKFTNTNTAARTYTLQDSDGELAHVSNVKDTSWGESFINNFRSRVLEDFATYFPNAGGYEIGRLHGLNASPSFLMIPSAVKDSTLYVVKGSQDYTVVRASNATYVDEEGIIQTALDDVARIDYTDNSDGVLLTEPQSTNLYLNNAVMVTQDITTTADDFTVTFFGTGTITFSGTFVGSLVGTGENDRVSLTFTATAGTLTSTISGTVTNGQAENLPYATSVIFTAGTTVTRLKDEINNAGTVDDFNSPEGVFYCNISSLFDTLTSRLISLSDGTDSNRVNIGYATVSNRIEITIRVAASTSAFMVFGAPDTTVPHEIAVKWALNNFALYINGVEVTTDTSGTTFPASTLTTLAFDRSDGNFEFFGKTQQIKVYKSIAEAQKDLTYIT